MALFSPRIQRHIFTGIGGLLVLLSLMTPFWHPHEPASYVGSLLVWAAILEIIHGFRRADDHARLSAWFSGTITLIIGILLLNAILFQRESLVEIILALFFFDASRYFILYFRSRRRGTPAWNELLAAVGNAIVIVLILIFRGQGVAWSISICGALRILATVYHLYTARLGETQRVAEDVLVSLGVKNNKELDGLVAKLGEEDDRRERIDASWIVTFLFILFFIHLGRMGPDRTALGILSPLVAVVGDIFIALTFAFAFIAPIRTIFRRITGLFLVALIRWVQKVPEQERRLFSLRTLAMAWIRRQLRLSISIRKSGYSLLAAFRNGVKIGLPFAALLAAIMPVLGMSWYFDTENWASGVWDGWAGARTEVWRVAMSKASGEEPGSNAFRLRPDAVSGTADFSFVVIGDPGEGDPSQHILKDQILKVSGKPDVRFVVISSDIVYPSGAMHDYERKFFLPFKGLTKPVYAIPGNHDWYDALDGFVVTFFTPDAAKQALEARAASDLQLTSTTSEVIGRMINQAAFLRSAYRLPTGFQNAPFFQVSTDYFVFLAVDTGVRRKVDAFQLAWIRSVLEVSRDKYVMVLLGHPFYAIGEYQGDLNPDFRALHDLLREYKVPLVMAGDTHDMEYYREPPQNADNHTMHHFVNGGGGAYLSIGAAMASKDSRPTEDWAIYPSREPLMQKIDSLTPRWKYPAWVWLKKYNGYPFSAEWLSAAFDYNQAPYFQSFMEVKVELSRNRIRLIPYGIHGQLKWSDFEYAGEGKPQGADAQDLAEWTMPIKPDGR